MATPYKRVSYNLRDLLTEVRLHVVEDDRQERVIILCDGEIPKPLEEGLQELGVPYESTKRYDNRGKPPRAYEIDLISNDLSI